MTHPNYSRIYPLNRSEQSVCALRASESSQPINPDKTRRFRAEKRGREALGQYQGDEKFDRNQENPDPESGLEGFGAGYKSLVLLQGD